MTTDFRSSFLSGLPLSYSLLALAESAEAELKSASSFLVVVALVYCFPTASTGLGTAGLVGTTCPLHFPELGKSFFISRLVYPSDLSSRSFDIDFVVDDEPIGKSSSPGKVVPLDCPAD